MTDLFLILWAADVAGGVRVFCVIGAVVGFIAGLLLLAHWIDDEEAAKPWALGLLAAAIFCAIVAAATPSRQTILVSFGAQYAAELGIEAGLDETAHKAKRLLDKKLDEALEDGK